MVVTTNPVITGTKFRFANSIGLTPQIAAAEIRPQGTRQPPPTHIPLICPNAASAPTLAFIAVPNTEASEPTNEIPENPEPSSPVIAPTTVSIPDTANLLSGIV